MEDAKILEKFDIDYKKILIMLVNGNYHYEDFISDTGIDRGNLLDNKECKKIEEGLDKLLEIIKLNGTHVETFEQSERRKNSFKHIAINRKMSMANKTNKFRLYVCPDDKYLYYIVSEIIKRCYKDKKSLYLKFNRLNRLDKLVLFSFDKKDLMEKIKMIEDIKNDFPEMFKKNGHAISWILKTNVEGLYFAPEKMIKMPNGKDFASFGILMQSVYEEIHDLFYFKLGIKNNMDFKKYSEKELLNILKPICLEVFKRYGVLLYLENDEINSIVSPLFPGVGKPLNHSIFFNREKRVLEYGIRIKNNIFRFYEIPLAKEVPEDILKSNYPNYDEDYTRHQLRMLYPNTCPVPIMNSQELR